MREKAISGMMSARGSMYTDDVEEKEKKINNLMKVKSQQLCVLTVYNIHRNWRN